MSSASRDDRVNHAARGDADEELLEATARSTGAVVIPHRTDAGSAHPAGRVEAVEPQAGDSPPRDAAIRRRWTTD